MKQVEHWNKQSCFLTIIINQLFTTVNSNKVTTEKRNKNGYVRFDETLQWTGGHLNEFEKIASMGRKGELGWWVSWKKVLNS